MSPLKMGTRGSVSVESVQARAQSITSALDAGATFLPPADVDRARSVINKAAARTSIAGGHTVVALAGSTGSGKSSLFNDLVGANVAEVTARRPTTSTPTAAIWGHEPASALLDWLNVGKRYMVDDGHSDAKDFDFGPSGPPAPIPGLVLDGLLLLDLPDFDSTRAEHRLEADRVLDLADVFIWVTDPQKYADALLHEDYIAKLSAHDALTMVVLNQADRLTPEALAACRCDLLRLLEADGVDDPEVIVTSAKDGSGVNDLHHRISQAVTSRNAALRRLDAGLRATATVLRSGVADSEPRLEDGTDAKLLAALMRAAGVPVILDAVERDYRRETLVRTGGPFIRWIRALRPAPLKLLRLSHAVSGGSGGISLSDVRSVLGRSSLPPATPAARSAVALATRDLGDRASEGLPEAWANAVEDAVTPARADLADALDQAVIKTSLRARNPIWWAVFGFLQWILAIGAVAGFAWLTVLMVLGWLQLPTIETPRLGPLPYPFLLLAGSLVIGFLLTLLTRAIGRVGARRRKILVSGRLRQSISVVARHRLVAPVQAVLDRHRLTREHLEAARKR